MIGEIINLISDGQNRSVGEIAEQLGFDYETVTAMVEFMQQKGILPRQQHPGCECNCSGNCDLSVRGCLRR